MGIKGLTDVHTKVSTVGRIRTGIKKISKNGKEYPEETPHFILNPFSEVEDKKGNPVMDPKTGKAMIEINEDIKLAIEKLGTDKPKQLTVIFPMDPLDTDDLFVSAYMKWWGNGVLKCIGDGEFAHYKGKERVIGLDDPRVEVRPITNLGWTTNRICNAEECPQALSGVCKPQTSIRFMLPEVSDMKIFQLDSNSRQVVTEIFGDLKLLKGQLARKGFRNLAGVPLTMYREKRANTKGPDGSKGMNYIVKLKFNETKFEEEKKKAVEGGQSLLSYGAMAKGDLPSISVDPLFHDKPNYDLLPQSEHGRLQTGDITELPTVETYQDGGPDQWVELAEVQEKFNAYAVLLGTQVTPAKMKARARKYKTKEELIQYLDSKLSEGTSPGVQA